MCSTETSLRFVCWLMLEHSQGRMTSHSLNSLNELLTAAESTTRCCVILSSKGQFFFFLFFYKLHGCTSVYCICFVLTLDSCVSVKKKKINRTFFFWSVILLIFFSNVTFIDLTFYFKMIVWKSYLRFTDL